MEPWAIWLIIAAGLAAMEILSGDFFLLMIGGGAAAAAVASAVGAPLWLALVIFAVVSLVLVLGVRPLAKRALLSADTDTEDGARSSIGKTAIVTQQVDPHGGRIKVGSDEWSALSQLPFERFAVGQTVRIVAIRGAHAIVATDLEIE